MLLLGILVSSVLLASGLIDLYFTYRENLVALSALQKEKALAAASRIEQYIKDIEHQVSLTTLPQAGAGISLLDQRRLDCLKLLRQVPAITDIVQVDQSGRELLRVSRVGLDVVNSRKDHSTRPEFKETIRAGTWYGPVHFRRETEPYLSIGVAHTDQDSGVTLVEMNLKFIWDLVSQIRVGKTGYAYVVDTNGQLIAHPDSSLVLQKSNLLSLQQVQVALAGGELGAGDLYGGGPTGDRRTAGTVFSAYAHITPLNWVVFVEQPRDEAFAPLYGSFLRVGILLAAGLVTSLLASLALARRMVTPIRALQVGAATIGSGQLHHRINVKTGDELELLADAFNQMAARIEESYSVLEKKVEERTRELESVNRHKSEFLANMSHELRTPLNAIIGFSEVLNERMFGELNDKQAEYVQDIYTSGRHLHALINDILDLSKIEAGRMELDLSSFTLSSVVDAAVTLLRERAHRAGVKLEVAVSADLGEVRADERKLKQILLNLLSNALKFTPTGGRIGVTARRDNGVAAISVSDTGIGIAPENHEIIFEEFRQVHGDSLHPREGTGLGLALTRKFVEMHGGKIWVQSELGKGSTFTFNFPVQL